MAEQLVLKAKLRQDRGKRASRKMRTAGLVPAIIYGHKEAPVSVELDYHDLFLELKHRHRLLDIELDGNRQKLLVKEVQHDHLGDKIVHIDLTRVSLDERVKVRVPVELRGIPAGVSEGGVLDQVMAEIELECLVTSIPDNIRVPVSHLKLGESLYARDLPLPEGVTLVTDKDVPVAAVRLIAEEVAPAAAPAEGEGVEPVLIRKPAGEEEGAEEEKK